MSVTSPTSESSVAERVTWRAMPPPTNGTISRETSAKRAARTVAGGFPPNEALLACPRLSTLLDERAASRAKTLEAAPVAVTVQNVSKTFRLPHQRYSTLKERVLHPFRSRTFDELNA